LIAPSETVYPDFLAIERSETHDSFWPRLTDADVLLRQNPPDKLLVADAMGVNGYVNVLRPAVSPLDFTTPSTPMSSAAGVSGLHTRTPKLLADQVGVALSAAASRRSCRP
jgi:hypothetical protein